MEKVKDEKIKYEKVRSLIERGEDVPSSNESNESIQYSKDQEDEEASSEKIDIE